MRRPPKPVPPATQRVQVFISHDARDADLAAEFGQLLADLTAGSLKHFRSTDTSGDTGLDYGAAWYPELMRRLEEANDVVALLTPRSVERPWILYEAGVAIGSGRANVFGVAIGLPLAKANSGPFSQFQNCADDEKSLTGLVMQLIRRNLPEAEPKEKPVRAAVKEFRAKVELVIKTKRPAPVLASAEDLTAHIYEEVKALTRELRLVPSWRQLGPRFFEAFPLAGPGSAGGLGWLIFLSALRDTLPWFYELGLGLYRFLEAGDAEGVARERERVLRAVEQGMRNAWLRSAAVEGDSEQAGRLHFVADLIEIYLGQLAPVQGEGARGKPTSRASAKKR